VAVGGVEPQQAALVLQQTPLSSLQQTVPLGQQFSPQHVEPFGQHGYLAASHRLTQGTSPGRQHMPCVLLMQTGPRIPLPVQQNVGGFVAVGGVEPQQAVLVLQQTPLF
jgi:hypothetical protein